MILMIMIIVSLILLIMIMTDMIKIASESVRSFARPRNNELFYDLDLDDHANDDDDKKEANDDNTLNTCEGVR